MGIQRMVGSLRLMLSLAVASSFGLASRAAAESEAPICHTDEDCGADQACIMGGNVCIDTSEICTASEDCVAAAICDLGPEACPLEGDRCDLQAWGLCREVPSSSCDADADCGEDALCWVTFTRDCAPGDAACEAAPYATCENDWLHFCGSDVATRCSAQEACHEGRCVLLGYEAQASAIAIDAAKEARLRTLWRDGRCGVHPDSCDDGANEGGCATAASSATWWSLLLIGAFVMGARRLRRR